MLRCLVICLFCSSFAFVETAKRAASASPFAPFFFTTNNPSNSPCPLLFTLFSGGGLVPPRPLPFFFLLTYAHTKRNQQHITLHITPHSPNAFRALLLRAAAGVVGREVPKLEAELAAGRADEPALRHAPADVESAVLVGGRLDVLHLELDAVQEGTHVLGRVLCLCRSMCLGLIKRHFLGVPPTPRPPPSHHTHTCTHS